MPEGGGGAGAFLPEGGFGVGFVGGGGEGGGGGEEGDGEEEGEGGEQAQDGEEELRLCGMGGRERRQGMRMRGGGGQRRWVNMTQGRTAPSAYNNKRGTRMQA